MISFGKMLQPVGQATSPSAVLRKLSQYSRADYAAVPGSQ